MHHILNSGHRVINGIFMAVSYHTDLSVHHMVYDDERNKVLSKMGPFVMYIREFAPTDEQIAEIYGTEVSTALMEYSKAKEKV